MLLRNQMTASFLAQQGACKQYWSVSGFPFKCCFWLSQRWLLLLATSTRLLTPKGAPVSQSICFHANSTPTCLLLLFANYTRWKDKCLCFAFLAHGNSCKNTLRCSPSAWGEECLWNRDLCLGNWQSFSAEFKIKEEISASWHFFCL